jgi:hypothetical protein
MQLRDYINAGIEATGDRKHLAKLLGMTPDNVSNAKSHGRGLPNDACVKLATLIDANPLEVIAASELATEKKNEKREFWSHLLATPSLSMLKNRRFTE